MIICTLNKNRIKQFKIKNRYVDVLENKIEYNATFYNPETFEPMTRQEYLEYKNKKNIVVSIPISSDPKQIEEYLKKVVEKFKRKLY
jgi:hypothetical protein